MFSLAMIYAFRLGIQHNRDKVYERPADVTHFRRAGPLRIRASSPAAVFDQGNLVNLP